MGKDDQHWHRNQQGDHEGADRPGIETTRAMTGGAGSGASASKTACL
jgi:hypothetical protein